MFAEGPPNNVPQPCSWRCTVPAEFRSNPDLSWLDGSVVLDQGKS